MIEDYESIPDEDDIRTEDDFLEDEQTRNDPVVTKVYEDHFNYPVNTTQETLLSYLISNHDAWVLCAPVIKPEYFEQQYQPVVSQIIKHVGTYKQVPNPLMIEMETGIRLKHIDNADDPRTLKWIMDETETFCRLQAMKQEIIRAAKTLATDKSQSTMETIYKHVKEITQISVQREPAFEIHRDGIRMLTTKEKVRKESSGWSHLDLVTNGGFPRPGMIIFAAGSGVGKTVSLVNVALNKSEMGSNVAYISLELAVDRLNQRFLSAMTGIPIKIIENEWERVKPELDNRIHYGKGKIFIKRMKMAGTTVTDIYAYIRELEIREGVKIDTLCLDYLDLLHPMTAGIKLDNIHLKDKYASEELYDLTDELKITTFTASQLTKDNDDKAEHDQSRAAGGVGKVRVCDYLIFIRRNFDDDHAVLLISKGRDGGEGRKIPLRWNIHSLRMTDASDEMLQAENPNFDIRTMRPMSPGSRPQNRGPVPQTLNSDTEIRGMVKAQQALGASDPLADLDDSPLSRAT